MILLILLMKMIVWENDIDDNVNDSKCDDDQYYWYWY